MYKFLKSLYGCNYGRKYLLSSVLIILIFPLTCVFASLLKFNFLLFSVITIMFLIMSVIIATQLFYYTLYITPEKNIILYFITSVISVIIFIPLLFSTIYYIYYEYNKNLFTVVGSDDLGKVDFYYMSFLTFFSGGCGEIAPNSTVIRIISLLEIFTGIIVFVFVIANTNQLIGFINNRIEKNKKT